eukprot:CAMPEP_0116830624 /NCGR_PEP_ID=MMETSP0418-20121206/4864_1 /TAXON_ID=1158023 /ORGANISM="Astrosyne radiata, Strain 13vi08-1A" /LENGTH=343 /DNA_ID=CAMNT_0004459743 /DNA_START=27 /DNA_END=1058 /DNA_ORIENTATION=+
MTPTDASPSNAMGTGSRSIMHRSAPAIDLSWKEGGSAFPKSSSRVGNAFQVTEIPKRISAPKPREELYDQVWDPKRAEAAGALDTILVTVPPNKREAAFVALHELGYNTDLLKPTITDVKVLDGSDWTEEEKKNFRSEMFRLRKDLVAVSKSVNKSINNCFTYYLGTFKKSDHYRLLKTVCEEERADRQAASEQGLDACGVCGDGGSLLICDGCEGEYHMACLQPPLANVPEGNWECDDCVNRKFLDARENLIRNSRIYERVNDRSKRKSTSSNHEGDTDSTDGRKRHRGTDRGSIILRPSSKALQAVRTLATGISKALSAPVGEIRSDMDRRRQDEKRRRYE